MKACMMYSTSTTSTILATDMLILVFSHIEYGAGYMTVSSENVHIIV